MAHDPRFDESPVCPEGAERRQAGAAPQDPLDESVRPRNRGALIALAALTICLLLALASCYSYLTTCSSDPTAAANLALQGERARSYWRDKYGEDVTPTETHYALYYGGWMANSHTDEVVVNMGDEDSRDRLVYLDLKSGRISDNRQSAEVQAALSDHVKQRLAAFAADSGGSVDWATTTSDLANMPEEFEPLTDWEWELAQTPGSLLSDYYGMTREEANELSRKRQEQQLEEDRAAVVPIVFNRTPLSADNGLTFEDEDPVGIQQFFCTRYDGDIEAFMAAERESGGLAMDTDDTIYLAVSGEEAIPSGISETEPPAWKGTADELASWLDDAFSAHPGVEAMPTGRARKAQQDTSYRYGSWPARYGNDEEGTKAQAPILDNWVYLDEAHSIRIESNLGGVTLADTDVSVRKSAATQDSVNEALARTGKDAGLIIEGDIYEVTFSERVRAAAPLPADADEYDDALPLRLALYRPDLTYEFSSGQAGEPSTYVRNDYLYAMEALSVGADGRVENAEDAGTGGAGASAGADDNESLAYGAAATAAIDGWPVGWGMHDASHTLLVFVAKRTA